VAARDPAHRRRGLAVVELAIGRRLVGYLEHERTADGDAVADADQRFAREACMGAAARQQQEVLLAFVVVR
jgi:hypothetical protein